MKIPIWLRWSAVAMSAFLASFYVAYATGFHGFTGDIPSGTKVLQPGTSPSKEEPFPGFTADLYIPSSKSGGIFRPSPPTSADESDGIGTESPTTISIPQSGLPELGLFDSEQIPLIVVPRQVLINSQREYMGSSKFGPIFRPPAESPSPPIEMTEPKAKGSN